MTDQRPIGFWLTLVDRLIDERFAGTLDEHGVTRRQWQLLSVLRRGPSSVAALDAEIAPFLAAAPPSPPGEEAGEPESSIEHLAELLESGWVLQGDGVDGAAEFSITDRGAAAYERLFAVVETNRSAAMEGISRDEYDATVAMLEKVARNLGWPG